MFNDDNPIRAISEDKLNRSEFVSRLSSAITSWESNESLVIGVYGRWGSGKSSILNMLEENIKNHGSSSINTYIIRFDPWFFNSTEQLLKSFYLSMSKEIKKALPPGSDDQASQLIKEYISSLSFAITPELFLGPIRLSLPIKKKDNESPDELRQKIIGLLGKLDGRVVMMIDNIDRLDAEEILLMFKLVRLCSDFPKFSYILAFDRIRVETVLQKQANISKDFLKKIIQVDITLPNIEQHQIDKYLLDGIDKLTKSVDLNIETSFNSRFGPIYQKHIKKTIIDLRSAKRYLNALTFSLPLVKDEVNYCDSISLEFIRVFFPNVYNELPKWEEYLIAYDYLPTTGTDIIRKERLTKFEDFKSFIKGEQSSEEVDQIVGILGELFPIFGAYIKNPNNPALITHEFREIFDYDLRISTSEHFYKYFRLRVNAGDIPTTFIRNLIARLNDYQGKEATNKKPNEFIELHNNNILPKVLSKLILFRREISVIGRSNLEKIILKSSSLYSWEENGFSYSEGRLAVKLFLLNNEAISPDKYERLLIHTIRTSPSLVFIIDVLLMGLHPDNKSTLPQITERNHIIEILRERINRDLTKRGIDVFELYPNKFQMILEIWKSEEWLNEPNSVNDYLVKISKKNPHAIGMLLSPYLEQGNEIEKTRFRFDDFSKNYPVEFILNLINSTDIKVHQTKIEDVSISLFINEYQSRYRSKSG